MPRKFLNMSASAVGDVRYLERQRDRERERQRERERVGCQKGVCKCLNMSASSISDVRKLH